MRVGFALLLVVLAFGCSKIAPTDAGLPPNATGDKKAVPPPPETNDKPKISEKDSGKKGVPSYEKPDFTVTAEEFGKEFKSDDKAFNAKYRGKVVEISGKVWKLRQVQNVHHLLLVDNSDGMAHLKQQVACQPKKALLEQFRGLSQGQDVTLRGFYPKDGYYAGLTECEIMKRGPDTGVKMPKE